MLSEATTFLTTGWGIADHISDDAEEQWKNDIKSYRYARFGDSHESVWRIINETVKMPLPFRGIPRGNLRIDLGNITSDDRVILITGPSGSGKSTFLNTATLGTARVKVEHSLEPRLQTRKTQVVRFPHPPTMQSYVLVEVPGFDAKDENTKDNIVVWGKSLFEDIEIAGIIYLHSVSDTKIDRLKVDLFKTSYSGKGVPRVAVATSMWVSGQGRTSQEDRQNKLNKSWSESLNSLTVLAFDNTFKSAWDIIDAVAPPGKELESGQIWEGAQQHFVEEIMEELGDLIEKYQKSLEHLFSALLR
ncbi:hypothetical protein BDZ94DRAFT_1325222 [Collybia nuda]|uniref:G domain-containing protein n=1 Tax=Collybia nuda TaxID=64659 RepID=A0A9P5XYE6_9AGAR|nr:hypothetical protein BDZ94DRAFT_1325222 [Collybia nuda]